VKCRDARSGCVAEVKAGVLDVAEGTRFGPGERVVVPAALLPSAVRRQERFDVVVELLGKNPRMTLKEMSTRTKIPISTVFDMLRRLQDYYALEVVFVRKPVTPPRKWKKCENARAGSDVLFGSERAAWAAVGGGA